MKCTISFEIPDNIGNDALFNQREIPFYRIPYELEKTVLQFIYIGQPKEMVDFCKSLLFTPSFNVPMGKTSGNQLRLLKYSAVAAIALACRAAIEGGAIEAIAYSKSDTDISLIDGMNSQSKVLMAMAHSLIGFAEIVQHSRSKSGYSNVIRSCIEYITVHLHQNITLDELSDGTDYSKEYLARLFRKEVGVPVSDYILNAKIEEGKNLLQKGRSCSDVAHILGFSSQSYFIRQFKKTAGITPRVYLKTYQAVAEPPLL